MSRRYFLRYELASVEGPDDYEAAKEYFQNTILYPQLVDVQQLPKTMDDTHTAEEIAEVVEEGAQTYPDDAPAHPWDQGLWIFPDDHPLAAYERQAKQRNESSRDTFLKLSEGVGALGLPPAPRMLDNDS